MKKRKKDKEGLIGIIILAAGASRRMGRPKQLLKIGQYTLIEKAVNLTQAIANQRTVVVLGANAHLISPFIESTESLDFVINENWEAGMGTTLKTGLQFLIQKEPDLVAVIVMVCDQPYLSTKELKALIEIHHETGTNVVTTTYNDIKGVPALFSSSLFPKLLNLNEDEGARKIIKKYHGRIEVVDFPKGIYDLDTPDAYEAYLKEYEND